MVLLARLLGELRRRRERARVWRDAVARYGLVVGSAVAFFGVEDAYRGSRRRGP